MINRFTTMQEKSYINGATILIIPLNNFMDSSENKISISNLPKDIKFQAIQGFEKLMACFYSESEDMAYWSEVPCKKGERFSIGDSSSIVTDLKIDELTNYMFEEYESIYKSGYEANKIGWQQALIKWKSDFNAEAKDGFKWEDKPFVLICEFKRTK